MDSSLSLSTSCRILTICSSLNRAIPFIQQLQTLYGLDDEAQHPNKLPLLKEDEHSKLAASNERVIPWTISNKYYSAQVHFLARTAKGLAPFHLKDVPAVIFVWQKGHAYKHHIERICRDRDLNGSEPEVSLAVRIETHQEDSQPGISDEDKRLESNAADEEEEKEEEFEDSGEIDEFLSSKGFEFIDIPASGRHEDEYVLAEAIPSLPRVLDALSTIMWPSMQASTQRQNRARPRIRDQLSSSLETDRNDAALLDWAQNSFDQNLDIDDEASFVTSQTPISRMAHQARMRKEMEELRRWLEEDGRETHSSDVESIDDPWRRAASSATSLSGIMTVSPTSEEGGLSYSVPAKEDKFDDDFTVFVSAPADGSSSSFPHSASSPLKLKEDANSSSGEAFPSLAFFGDSSFTAPHPVDDENIGFGASGDTSFDSIAPSDQHHGIMYHSLGSASDLDEMLDEDASPAHSSSHFQYADDDLPTESEIRASAQRIFGPLPSPPSSSSPAKKFVINNIDSEEINAEFSEFNDDMDLDLTHMVSAIQGMKAEISGMENMDDRRKAAARVALGLVYGLDRRG